MLLNTLPSLAVGTMKKILKNLENNREGFTVSGDGSHACLRIGRVLRVQPGRGPLVGLDSG